MTEIPKSLIWVAAIILIAIIVAAFQNHHGDTYRMITGKDRPTNFNNLSATNSVSTNLVK